MCGILANCVNAHAGAVREFVTIGGMSRLRDALSNATRLLKTACPGESTATHQQGGALEQKALCEHGQVVAQRCLHALATCAASNAEALRHAYQLALPRAALPAAAAHAHDSAPKHDRHRNGNDATVLANDVGLVSLCAALLSPPCVVVAAAAPLQHESLKMLRLLLCGRRPIARDDCRSAVAAATPYAKHLVENSTRSFEGTKSCDADVGVIAGIRSRIRQQMITEGVMASLLWFHRHHCEKVSNGCKKTHTLARGSVKVICGAMCTG